MSRVPFTVVTAVTGASLHPRTILIFGIAILLADRFSMGASNFLSIQSLESIRQADGLALAEPFPVRQGAVTFAALVLAGAIPLLTYVIDLGIASFQVAVALTLVALFVGGALRATVADGC